MNSKQNSFKFEVDPLDINLAKIQFELQKEIEAIPDCGDFTPLVKIYESKDPTKNISNIKISCHHKNDKTNKQRTLELKVNNKKKSDTYSYTLANGNKKDMIEALKTTQFLEVCKKVINKIDETLN